MRITDDTLRRLLASLEEDVGDGDLTTQCTVDPEIRVRASIVAKQAGVLCGLPVTHVVVTLASPEAEIHDHAADGDRVEPGQVVSEWVGPAGGLLKAERLALNLICRLSGISSMTRRFVDAVGQGNVCIRDTRKTTPLWRELEKYAVRVGGGTSHRCGLYDMILIKDNHIQLAGGIETAVQRAVERRPPSIDIGVECQTLDDVRQALQYPVHFILLDNMDNETMREAAALCKGKVRTEASGRMSLERVAEVAATGVTDISVGALTHSTEILDFSMRMDLEHQH